MRAGVPLLHPAHPRGVPAAALPAPHAAALDAAAPADAAAARASAGGFWGRYSYVVAATAAPPQPAHAAACAAPQPARGGRLAPVPGVDEAAAWPAGTHGHAHFCCIRGEGGKQ